MAMCAPDPASYLLVAELLKSVLGPLHAATGTAVRELVWALLVSQSLHPAALMRALPALQTVRARQGFRRVRRLLGNAVVTSAALTPWLLRAALACVPVGAVLLVLDSTRCGRWEVFTLGIGFHGRVLPIAWALLPYPWPKKRFTPTVVALLDRTFAVWPPERPVHLVADRGFPSLKLFRCLHHWREHLPLDYTVRLRASDWVRQADGTAVKVGDRARDATVGPWTGAPAAYQRRGWASPLAHLVLGRGEPSYPAHQQGPADQARRAARAQQRQAHVRSKHQTPAVDRVWALLSTAPTATAAVAWYSRRFSTEGTYRDLKSWDLEIVARHETDPRHLDGLVGLAAVGYWVQAIIGAEAGRVGDASTRARQQQWCTTDRLSVFWRGRQVLHDRAFDWRPWLRTRLPTLTRLLAWEAPPAPPAEIPAPAAPPLRVRRRPKEAA